MTELDVLKVDVFTHELYNGNPATVVLDADQLDEVLMQSIAFESGSPATAFVLRSRRADVRMRFFSQFSEEPLSGHGTIGALWCLAEKRALGGVPGGRHRLETAAGILPFSVEKVGEELRRIWMTQKRPMFSREGDIKEVASSLGVGAESLFHEQFPLNRASTGIPFLLVPVRSMEIISKLDPKRDEVMALCRELDVAGIEVYTWSVLDPESTVHARCFLPSRGISEDPASGLASGALGAYFVENEFIDRGRFENIVVEQGHWIGRPSKIYVKVEKHGSTIRKVEVGGSARVSLRGRLSVA